MFNSKANYDDLYFPQDGIGTGRLTISEETNSLKVLNNKPWGESDKEFIDLHGTLKDGSKASLIDCLNLGKTQYRWGEGAQYEQHFLPNYILIGESFISSDDKKIKKITYHFENIDCLFIGSGLFGDIHPTQEEFREILKTDHIRYLKIAAENNWKPHKFEPKTGKHPTLYYSSGVWEILKCKTDIGSISFQNRTSTQGPSIKGFNVKNQIAVSLEFKFPRTIFQALQALHSLHSFFELCLGKKQRYLWIEAELEDKRVKVENQFEVYCGNINNGIIGKTEPTSFSDILLTPECKEDAFCKVMSGWLNSHRVLGKTRNRFASSFYNKSYTIDRIVGAANMFDLLPKTYAPKKNNLDENTLSAISKCRETIKSLPEGNVSKDRILSYLGLLKSASLNDKVCFRADIITKNTPKRFPDLYLACKQAVLCRNHFVHGRGSHFDYDKHINAFCFLTETLEFVFAVSHLIELGWDFNSWCTQEPWHSHPFARYINNYDYDIQNLKSITNS